MIGEATPIGQIASGEVNECISATVANLSGGDVRSGREDGHVCLGGRHGDRRGLDLGRTRREQSGSHPKTKRDQYDRQHFLHESLLGVDGARLHSA